MNYFFVDAENKDLEGLAGADYVYVGGELVNNSSNPVTCKIYTAIYSAEGKLIAADVSEELTIETTDDTWFVEFDKLGGTGSYMKIFAWSDMVPVAENPVE